MRELFLGTRFLSICILFASAILSSCASTTDNHKNRNQLGTTSLIETFTLGGTYKNLGQYCFKDDNLENVCEPITLSSILWDLSDLTMIQNDNEYISLKALHDGNIEILAIVDNDLKFKYTYCLGEDFEIRDNSLLLKLPLHTRSSANYDFFLSSSAERKTIIIKLSRGNNLEVESSKKGVGFVLIGGHGFAMPLIYPKYNYKSGHFERVQSIE